MKLSIIIVVFCQVVMGAYATRYTNSNIGTLAHNRFERVVNRTESHVAKLWITRTYIQCVTGFRNPKSDFYCQKLALLLSRQK